MTLSTTSNKVICAGNGVTTTFSYNFIIQTIADALVIYTDATGVSTTLSTSQFTITGLNNPAGGTVTYPLVGSPIATGTTLTIMRNAAMTQPTSLSNQGAYYSTAVEGALDRTVMLIQQLNELVGRNLSVPATDATAPGTLPAIAARAGQLLGFDANGDPTAVSSAPAGTISSAMAPVVGAASLGAGRTAFGLGGMAVEAIGAGLADDGSGNCRVNFATATKAVNYNVASTDHLKQFLVTGPITFTLPATSGLWNGFTLFADVSSGTLTLTANAADTIEGSSSGGSCYVASGSRCMLVTNGAGSWFARVWPCNASARQPGGYLTATSGYVAYPLDQTSATTIYYTPDAHGFIPVFTGSVWVDVPFSELSCALNASQQLANSIHDVYVFMSNGAPTLAIGPAWRNPGTYYTGSISNATNATPIVVTAASHGIQNNDIVYVAGVQGNTAANGVWTASSVAGSSFTLTGSVGSGAYTSGTGVAACRGVGSGTAQISKQNGLWVNTTQITAYNSSTSYVIGAGQGLYVGSIFFDGSAGQVTCHRTWGQSRKWGIWNAYNRKELLLRAGDSTSTWNSASASWRASNNQTNNNAVFFCGLPEENVFANFSQTSLVSAGWGYNSVGYGTSTVPTGLTPPLFTYTAIQAVAVLSPMLGAHPLFCMEKLGGTTWTQYGTEAYMGLYVRYKG